MYFYSYFCLAKLRGIEVLLERSDVRVIRDNNLLTFSNFSVLLSYVYS